MCAREIWSAQRGAAESGTARWHGGDPATLLVDITGLLYRNGEDVVALLLGGEVGGRRLSRWITPEEETGPSAGAPDG